MIKKAFQDTLLRKRSKVQNNVYGISFICIKEGREDTEICPLVCKIFLKGTQKADNIHCSEEGYLKK